MTIYWGAREGSLPRTVVPPIRGSAFRGPNDGEQGGDSLPEKLVKYVPAETLAFFVPSAALIGGERKVLVIASVLVASIGTVGYLWLSAQALASQERPLVHFYILAVLAFLCWAIATSPNVGSLIGLDQIAAGLILLAGVFLIPMADSVLNAVHHSR